MIGALPALYPDELLYSLCARYCDRMQYTSKRSVVQELFGTGNVIASVGLPSHIDDFVTSLPPGHPYTAEYLINNHTLLPFYGPFLPLERLSHLRQDMRGRNGPALHMRAGLMASRVPLPLSLRFCQQCVEEDRRRFGECYWHRIHQAPGVEICPLHRLPVRNSSAHARNVQTRYEFIPAESAVLEALPGQFDGDEQLSETLFALASDAQWLLNQQDLPQDLLALQRRYHVRLADIGLSTYRGRIDKNALLSRFKNIYVPELLRLLHCELDERMEESWLVRLARKPESAHHPLHHLLLIHCLGQTAETFFHLPTEDKPFSDGPWPCLNPACVHYLEPELKECNVAYSSYVSGKPIGTFSCECGFIYSRTGPDRSAEDRWKRGRIEAFGPVWEKKLGQLWVNEMLSLRAIARQLGVDPLTIKRHAARIGLPFPRPVRRCLPPKIPEKTSLSLAQASEGAALETYRSTWLATIQAHPGAGVKILRSIEPGAYTWLYKNDRAWLQAHTSLSKKFKHRPQRIDWERRDLQLAEEIREAALLLKNLQGRPVHITISSLGREIGQLALLQQHLDRLPRTARLLSELVETREAFAVRRVWWAMTVFSQGHIYPKRWLLIRRAGVARLIDQPQVRDAIDAALQALQPNVNNNSTIAIT